MGERLGLEGVWSMVKGYRVGGRVEYGERLSGWRACGAWWKAIGLEGVWSTVKCYGIGGRVEHGGRLSGWRACGVHLEVEVVQGDVERVAHMLGHHEGEHDWQEELDRLRRDETDIPRAV